MLTAIEALKHIRTMVKVAQDADDLDAVQKLLKEIDALAANALKPQEPLRRQ